MSDLKINIGQAVKLCQIPAKTIRYYEEIGLLAAAKRQENGYRYYDSANIAELNLVKGAREAGFTLAECADLMQLFRDKSRRNSDVKALTLKNINQMKEKISTLQNIVEKLEQLSLECVDEVSESCAILDGLAK